VDDSTSWTQIAQLPAGVHHYEDRDLKNDVTDFCYQVEAVEQAGNNNAVSRSIWLCLVQQPIVWVPNAFTPEISTNLNDWFGPKGTYFKEYSMSIYNRWGEKVFETGTGQPWSGRTALGEGYPEGVYMYRISLYSFDHKPYYFNGVVTILK
jgi:hypothetical protein